MPHNLLTPNHTLKSTQLQKQRLWSWEILMLLRSLMSTLTNILNCMFGFYKLNFFHVFTTFLYILYNTLVIAEYVKLQKYIFTVVVKNAELKNLKFPFPLRTPLAVRFSKFLGQPSLSFRTMEQGRI